LSIAPAPARTALSRRDSHPSKGAKRVRLRRKCSFWRQGSGWAMTWGARAGSGRWAADGSGRLGARRQRGHAAAALRERLASLEEGADRPRWSVVVRVTGHCLIAATTSRSLFFSHAEATSADSTRGLPHVRGRFGRPRAMRPVRSDCFAGTYRTRRPTQVYIINISCLAASGDIHGNFELKGLDAPSSP
jgi:hypothetical protein